MKNLTLALIPTAYSIKSGVTNVHAFNDRSNGWTAVPEWVAFMDEAGINEVWEYALTTFNPMWSTLEIVTKEEMVGYLLSNDPKQEEY